MNGGVFIKLEGCVSKPEQLLWWPSFLQCCRGQPWPSVMVEIFTCTPTCYFLMSPVQHHHHHHCCAHPPPPQSHLVSVLADYQRTLPSAVKAAPFSSELHKVQWKINRGLPPCHLLNAFTLTPPLPRLCNVICGLPWSCQWNTTALSYLNSSTVPLCVCVVLS